jgi:hypothetical protein
MAWAATASGARRRCGKGGLHEQTLRVHQPGDVSVCGSPDFRLRTNCFATEAHNIWLRTVTHWQCARYGPSFLRSL